MGRLRRQVGGLREGERRWLLRRTLLILAELLDALAGRMSRRRAARLLKEALRLLALWARACRRSCLVAALSWCAAFSAGFPEVKVGYAVAGDGSLGPSLMVELCEFGADEGLWAVAVEAGASGRFALFGAALVLVPVVEMELGAYAAWDSSAGEWTWALGAGILRF